MISNIKKHINVVPHAGTWIESSQYRAVKYFTWSFPTRERGLKGSAFSDMYSIGQSFPTRERGLKALENRKAMKSIAVVPHAGTWIESG